MSIFPTIGSTTKSRAALRNIDRVKRNRDSRELPGSTLLKSEIAGEAKSGGFIV
jgi:hypothetical protein